MSGVNYIAFPFIGGIHISGLSIFNSTGSPSTSSAISFMGINRLLLKNMVVLGFVDNIVLDTCNTVLLDTVLSRTSTGDGVTCSDVLNSVIVLSGMANNTGNGLVLTGVNFGSFNIIIDQCFLSNNGSRGVNLDGGTFVVNFTNTIIEYNVDLGIRSTNSVSNILVDQCNIDNNDEGAIFAGERNTVTACIITNCTARGIQTGDRGLITGNHVASNGTIGIDMGSDTNNTIISISLKESFMKPEG